MHLSVKKIKRIVWVVIPTWNRHDDLLACLDSLSRVTYHPLRILVIDNASDDGSAESVETIYPFVTVIRLSENVGAPKASNIGFKHALTKGADYVLRLDSDTIVSPGFLEPLVNKAEEDPTIGVISPKIYYYDPPDLIWYAGVDAHPWHYGSINDHINKRDNEINDLSRDVDYVWGAAMLIKSEVLEKTKGFDPDFFIYYEEIDFCLRVKELGYTLYYNSKSTIRHKVGTQNPTPWTAYHWNFSKVVLYRKHAFNKMHLSLLIIYETLFALISALFTLMKLQKFSRNRGPLRNTFIGLWDGLHKKLMFTGKLE
jgi:GT2 family glycosyltransferase